MIKRAYQAFAKALVTPYTRAELPGWGKIYALFVGDYRRNWLWAGSSPLWLKGKLHGFQMQLNLAGWSNRSTYFLGRFYDLPTQLALLATLKPGDLAIDIGGNEGMMSLLMSRIVGNTGQVIAFEPNPGPRAIFAQNIAKNGITNITLLPCGLSDQDATLELHVPTVNTGEGSFGRPHYDEGNFSIVAAPVRIGDEILVGKIPALIKIDVEGFELNVINGLESTIARAKPILITEIVDTHLRNAGTSSAALMARLRSLGYSGMILTLKSGELAFSQIGDHLDVGDVMWRPNEDI